MEEQIFFLAQNPRPRDRWQSCWALREKVRPRPWELHVFGPAFLERKIERKSPRIDRMHQGFLAFFLLKQSNPLIVVDSQDVFDWLEKRFPSRALVLQLSCSVAMPWLVWRCTGLDTVTCGKWSACCIPISRPVHFHWCWASLAFCGQRSMSPCRRHVLRCCHQPWKMPNCAICKSCTLTSKWLGSGPTGGRYVSYSNDLWVNTGGCLLTLLGIHNTHNRS